MMARFTVAVAALFASAGLAAAAPPEPALVIQVKPVSRILGDIKEIIRQVGGPIEGNRLVKDFESKIKDGLGEKGFEGFDINRPVAIFAVLKEKAEDCSLGVVLPVTGEKEFLACLERIHLSATAVKDRKGVYTLDIPPVLPKASHLQFTNDGWVYLTFNDGEAAEAKDLVPVAELLKNEGPALVNAKIYPGRVPPKLLAGLLEQLDAAAAGIKGFVAGGGDPDAKFMATFLEQGPKLLRRYTETALKEVNEVGFTFNFDAASGDVVAEMTIVPKAGTKTAKEFAALKPTTNRFAGLVTKDAVVGMLTSATGFAPEFNEISVASMESSVGTFKQLPLPEKAKPIFEEFFKGVIRSVKAGVHDFGFALNGPDKSSLYSVLAGISNDDPSGFEKAMREAAKDSSLAKMFTFDVAKVGDVNIHKVELVQLLPDTLKEGIAKVFGENAPLYVAPAKDAVFFGFGTGALDGLKSAIAAKPGPAPAMDIAWNSERIVKLITAIDPQIGGEVAKHLGTDDKTASAMRFTVQGGQNLNAKFTLNVRYIPKLLMAFFVSLSPAGPPGVAFPARN